MAVTKTKKAASTSTAPSAESQKKVSFSHVYGAPAQHAQSSRKGKKAWRKNVDIGEVEEGLEKLREDIRTTGGPLHEKSDKELFMVDVTGNENVRKKLGKPLKSLEILHQRSAVPAVHSRPPKPASTKISKEAKDRLRRKAGRHMLFRDPTVLDVTEAVKRAGEYDVWSGEGEKDEVLEKLGEEGKEFIPEILVKKHVKPPKPNPIASAVAIPAVPLPHEGQSYNPTIEKHQQLLQQEHEKELAKEVERQKAEEVKRKMERVKALQVEEEEGVGAPGMKVDDGDVLDEPAEADAGQEQEMVVVRSTLPKQKTKQQRLRAAKALEEARRAQQAKARKRLLASLSSLPSLQKSLVERQAQAEARAAARRQARLEALRHGLAGKKLGKFKVPEPRVDVQLGDELAETLREMKPEGNLFRERFESLLQRARVEPRLPVTKAQRRVKTRMYEMHHYKRFV